MKKLILLVLFSLPLLIFAQSGTPLIFTEVIEVEGATATQLHDRCLDWFAKSYINSDKVLRSSSSDKLIASPLIPYVPNVFAGSESTKGNIRYTITVEFKEGKYRYSITDFYHTGNPVAKYGSADFGIITDAIECPPEVRFSTRNYKNKVWNDIKSQISPSILPLIESLKTSMTQEAAKTNDNW
jgi:hypothetical protein